MKRTPADYLRQAIGLAVKNTDSCCGGPFGAVIVKNGDVIAAGTNLVTSVNDPTAHAEIVAIRAASKALGTHDLRGCEIYASCEPCPMCVGAIYWSRLDRLYFACTRYDAAQAGFDDVLIYEQVPLAPDCRMIRGECMLREEGREAFTRWLRNCRKIEY
ncbi:MAG: nucleoside deaminase [Acidobacteriaceae bacterium]|nr:nucleoside deaminase [Acidobacteriaceae bacterium]